MLRPFLLGAGEDIMHSMMQVKAGKKIKSVCVYHVLILLKFNRTDMFFRRFFESVWLRVCSHRLFVIADARDNSITFSKALFEDYIKPCCNESAKVFVFKLAGMQNYGFCLNPVFHNDTVLADIQYNSKYKSIGFESLCPTVSKMFYDYHISDIDKPVKLSVKKRKSANLIYFEICRNLSK